MLHLTDKAYKEHYHCVDTIDSHLKVKNYTHPSSLKCVAEVEFRTIFTNMVTGTALFLTTHVEDPENFSILMCKVTDLDRYSDMPTDKIPTKKFRLKELGDGITEADRENSLMIGLVKLGLIPEPKPEKKKVEDAVVVRSDGQRVLDYSKLKKKVGGVEENSLNYSEINKIGKK